MTTTLCPTCQPMHIDWCYPELVLSVGLEDGTYIISILDNTSGMTYTQTVTASGGEVTIDTMHLSYALTPYSVYTVTFNDTEGNPVSWTSGYSEYDCVRLTFISVVDTTPAE